MKPVYFAVFTVSAGLIAFEVSLLQMLSIVQWHHFASLIIAVALLGFGSSGTAISLARRWLLDRYDRILPASLATCAVTIALAVAASQSEIARFDSYLVFVQTRHAVALVLTCIILTVPFFFGALAIGLTFVRFTDDVGRLYFWNLVGSGAGGLVALALMQVAYPQVIAPITGLFAAAGALPLAARSGSKALILGAVAASLVCAAVTVYPPELSPSQFKDISRALDLPDAKIVFRHPGPQGLIETVSAPASRNAPGLSLRYSGDVPVRDIVFVNGDAIGTLPVDSADEAASVYDYSTRALPYAMASVDAVLVLESGTGEAARHAQTHNARFVRAVDSHAELTHLWSSMSPDVVTEAVAARTFLEADTTLYDVIVLPNVGSFGGTVGLDEMEETYLMTREALHAAWDRLRPDGRIVVTVWMDYPFRASLQVLSSLMDLISNEVPDPRNHVAAIRSWSDITFAVSRSPIDPTTSDSIRAFAESRAFDPLLLPEVSADERNRFNELGDDSFFEYVDRLVGPDRKAFIESYPFVITPVTDDRPFAMRFLRWEALPDLVESFGDRTAPFFGLGLFIALLGLVVSIALSVILIIVPLLVVRGVRTGSGRILVYFGALGLAYFLVEIVFIQRFTLVLGHPVYAAAAVIAAMLIGSGVGSHFSDRLTASSRSLTRAAAVVATLVLLYIPLLETTFDWAIGLPMTWRAIVVLALILPPAFAMGFPFPLGLRSIAAARSEQVPWAWGVNGCFSVVGAAGAGLLAVEFGFTSVLIVAAASYGLAAAAMR